MRKITFFLYCLACASHERRRDISTSLSGATGITHSWKPTKVVDAVLNFHSQGPLCPLEALGRLLAASRLIAAYAYPFRGNVNFASSRPVAGSSKARVSMSSDESIRAEMLKLQAEKAALEAKKLELELDVLKLRKQESVADEAVENAAGEALSQAPFQASVRLSRDLWPEEPGKYHRFVAQDDQSLQVPSFFGKTRAAFLGRRDYGSYEGSFRVYFNLPSGDNEAKVLELLPTSDANALFGAVQVGFDNIVNAQMRSGMSAQPMKINATSTHMVVESIVQDPLQTEFAFGKTFGDVLDGVTKFAARNEPLPEDMVRIQKEMAQSEFNAMCDVGGIREGDIIRAISLPPDESGEVRAMLFEMDNPPWLLKLFNPVDSMRVFLDSIEEGMVILDGTPESVMDLFWPLVEMSDSNREVVLIIERPSVPVDAG